MSISNVISLLSGVALFLFGMALSTLNTELTLHTAYLWPKEVQ